MVDIFTFLEVKNPKIYAGVGSRDIPQPGEVEYLMEELGYFLSIEGLTLRTGNAKGSDHAFRRGAEKARVGGVQVFVPWSNYGKKYLKDRTTEVITVEGYEHQREASQYLTGWRGLSKDVKKIHAANAAIVFGRECHPRERVDFVITYCRDITKGGTGLVLRICAFNGIPFLNLFNEEHFLLCENWVKNRKRRYSLA